MTDESMVNNVLSWLRSGFPAGGWTSLAKLAGDASNRSYYRASGGDGRTVVVMKLADEPLKSEEVVDGERPVTLPFLDVGAFLEGGGIPVPRVLHTDLGAGYLVLEDLGDVTVERALAEGADKAALYRAAIHMMTDIQMHAERHPDAGCVAFRRGFGAGLLRWELEHFYEWMIVAWTGKTPAPAERAVLEGFFEEVVRRLTALPAGFVHRDFQSRNLMIHEGRLRIIDFQDALQGPYVYDLVALLRDSYIGFTPAEVGAFLGHFLSARRARGLFAPDVPTLAGDFHLQSLQRKLKDSGRFVYIDRVKKNPRFLQSIPRSLAYVRESFDALGGEFADAREVIARYCPEVA